VLISLPTMSYSTGVNSLELRWPGWASGWQLYAATDLNPPIAWTPVTNSISSSNGEFFVELPYSRATEFFNLISQ
jgi:hypothetical protein